MPFPKQCGSSSHDEVMEMALNANGNLVKIKNSKKFKGSIIEKMVSKKLISERALYLCEECYANESALEEVEGNNTCPSVGNNIERIENGDIAETDLLKIIQCVGEKTKTNIKKEHVNNNQENLENLNFVHELSAIDICLFTFLKAISTNDNDNHCVLNAAEHVISLSNKNYIGKLNFSLSLMTHFITGSRAAVELRGKYSPSGSYTSIMKYINENSVNQIPYPSGCDILVYFDNNQVLARNWNVKFDCKALISVSTTVLCLIPPTFTALQYEPRLSPLHWLSYVDCADVEPLNERLTMIFCQNRNAEISKLKEV